MDRILNTSDEVVRKTLLAICEDPHIEKKAISVIQQLEQHIQATRRDAMEKVKSQGTKRKAHPAEVHVCVKCKGTFTEDNNDERACQYHPGDLEEGTDFWLDWYQGDPEYSVEQMFEDCPERVDWSCCGNNGETDGCDFDWHRSFLTVGKARRA